MLDSLPGRALDLIVQYLRGDDNNQAAALHFAQVSQRLRSRAQRLVWEYFTLARALQSHTLTHFAHILPYVARLQISHNGSLSKGQWLDGLTYLHTLSWEHVQMVSVELDSFDDNREVVEAVIGFAHRHLSRVRELWVSLSGDFAAAQQMLSSIYPNLSELRIVGKAPPESAYRVEIAPHADLSAVTLDAQAARLTTAAEIVCRSRATLTELNIDEYTTPLAMALHLHPASAWTQYAQLRQIAITGAHAAAIIDGSRLPRAELLCFRGSAGDGSPWLMHSAWARLRLLVVDGLCREDVDAIGQMAPHLEVLRIGTGGENGGVDLSDVSHLLLTCARLTELSIEAPDHDDEEMWAEEEVVVVERPSDTRALIAGNGGNLQSLTLSSWALTFAQLAALLHSLPQLRSFEGALKPSALPPHIHAHNSLAHLSLVVGATRHPRALRRSILQLVSTLPCLRTLELYGAASPGIGPAIAHIAPQCRTHIPPL
ncbi:hypothetical protein GGI24_001429 [Coemansia furcata]|nr:hypothetical protein GGI24_001429 [Coemansia furcata]